MPELYNMDRMMTMMMLSTSLLRLEENPNMTMADGSNFNEDYPQYLDDWSTNHADCFCFFF